MSLIEEEEGMEKKSWKDYALQYSYVIVAVLIVVFFRGRWGIQTFDKAILAGGGIVIAGFMVTLVYAGWQNASPKAIFYWGHTTYDPSNVMICGNFKIIPRAIHAWGMYFRLPGALVFPRDANKKYGPNMAISAEMPTIDFNALPLDVQAFLMEHNIKGPYRIGYAAPDQYKEVVEDPEKISGEPKPTVSRLIQMITEQNKFLSFLRDMLKGKMKDVHAVVKFGKMVAEPKTPTDVLKEALLQPKKEE